MVGFWNAVASEGLVSRHIDSTRVPGATDKDEREAIRAEIDAYVAREVYGLTRDELSYVLDTFPIVEKRDKKKFGDYRTKLQILETYDGMQRATDTGEPHQSLLDPPPRRPPRGPH